MISYTFGKICHPNPSPRWKKREATISHKLFKRVVATDGMPQEVKWMVFKVKKKAVKSYFSKTSSKRGNLDDNKFKFEFEVAGRQQRARL